MLSSAGSRKLLCKGGKAVNLSKGLRVRNQKISRASRSGRSNDSDLRFFRRKDLPKIELELDDQIIETLETFASRQNRNAAEFLAWGVSNYTRGFLMMALGEWMPRDQWDALRRGDGCPLCDAIASPDLIDAYGYTVIDLPMGRLRLNNYPDTPGQCTFICKQHVCEPYHLSSADQAAFFADLMRVAQALEKVYQPIKMNLQILGNTIPHLHCHLQPRYHGDFAPNGPLAPISEKLPLPLEEFKAQSARILAALTSF